MSQPKVPLGIETFRKIREGGYHYVDKTAFIARMVEQGTYHFLARPHGFGKSLLIDTMKALFEGRKALFKGLAIHDTWDWSTEHPVVVLRFASGRFTKSHALHTEIIDQIRTLENEANVVQAHESAGARLRHVIHCLHARTGKRVVVLVDDYDKPIHDARSTADVARTNRDMLRALYAGIHDSDADIRFCFVTGASALAGPDRTLGLTRLTDLTLDAEYATLCGFTDAELDAVFAAELEGLDRDAIGRAYLGYGWGADTPVYNPIDIAMLLRHRRFKPWWFEAVSPVAVVEALCERNVAGAALEGMMRCDACLSDASASAIATEALLFQSGLLTVDGEYGGDGETAYQLRVPNRAVKRSLNRALLERLSGDRERVRTNARALCAMLRANDFRGLEVLFHALCEILPDGAGAESYTSASAAAPDPARGRSDPANIFYSYFTAGGLDVTVEDTADTGRLDLTVKFDDTAVLFALNAVGASGWTREGSTLAELKSTRHAYRHRVQNDTTHYVAVDFGAMSRKVLRFEVDRERAATPDAPKPAGA